MYFHKKITPQLLEHIGLQNMKVGVKGNFGWLATVCLMHAGWYKLLSVINHSENFLWTIIYTGLPHKRQKSDE